MSATHPITCTALLEEADTHTNNELGVLLVGQTNAAAMLYESPASVHAYATDLNDVEIIPLRELTFERINALPACPTRDALLMGYLVGPRPSNR